tara:strand:+ start:4505 stop:5224 length:720 start_codon:yes stop_codon:yes gene_type:complete
MDDLRKVITEPIDESSISDKPAHERTPWQTVIPLWNKNIGKPECVVKLMEMIVTSRRMNDTEKQNYREEFEKFYFQYKDLLLEHLNLRWLLSTVDTLIDLYPNSITRSNLLTVSNVHKFTLVSDSLYHIVTGATHTQENIIEHIPEEQKLMRNPQHYGSKNIKLYEDVTTANLFAHDILTNAITRTYKVLENDSISFDLWKACMKRLCETNSTIALAVSLLEPHIKEQVQPGQGPGWLT